MNQIDKGKFAPIALFVYNRPLHTRQTLNALAKNYLAQDSILYIFADGAKANATPTQAEALKEVRAIIREQTWCKEVYIIENEENKGLANSIIAGVTQVIEAHGKIIVLEDDMLTSPHFLRFMNEALNFYEKEEKVASIHAYIYEIPNLPNTFFLNDPGCWGWATWKRGWKLLEPDGEKLMREIKSKNLVKRFNYENTYPYFLMLERQVKGENDSWAIRWYASLFLKNKLALYPHQSLVHNIGNDASGTHAKNNEHYFEVKTAEQSIDIQIINIEPSQEAYQKIVDFWKNSFPQISVVGKIKNLLKSNKLSAFLIGKINSNLRKIQKIETEDTYWKGNYTSWVEALSISGGYDDSQSFEQIKASALKVKNGEAIFERDGKLFYKPDYNWLLINYLKIISKNEGNSLKILDFGGALGSTYFQHFWLLKEFENLSWNIVEQPHFVEFGKEKLSSAHLHFFETIHECTQQTGARTILLSGVLSYLSAPYLLIDEIKSLDFQYIIIDRTPFINLKEDILTVQYVNQQNLYEGSYPCWIFSEEKLKHELLEKYKIVDEQPSFDSISTKVRGLPNRFNNFKCWFLEKKEA